MASVMPQTVQAPMHSVHRAVPAHQLAPSHLSPGAVQTPGLVSHLSRVPPQGQREHTGRSQQGQLGRTALPAPAHLGRPQQRLEAAPTAVLEGLPQRLQKGHRPMSATHR